MTSAATPSYVRRAHLFALAIGISLSTQHCGGRATEPPTPPAAGGSGAGTSNGIDASPLTGAGGMVGPGGTQGGGGAQLGGAPQAGGSGVNGGSTAAGGTGSNGGSNANGGSQTGPDAASAEGALVPCPASAPSGACNVESQVCAYPGQTCTCQAGGWACLSCPVSQPAIGSSCPGKTGASPDSPGTPRQCDYGNVSCFCRGLADSQWSCGICPAAEPPNGQACGNTVFACVYPQATCSCGNAWDCSSGRCPPPISGPFACAGLFACQYPIEGQTCTCGSFWTCSCPAQAPGEGAMCVGGATTCQYGELECVCNNRQWSCAARCPAARPTEGSACASTLSCSYANGGLCACTNGAWHCSG